MQNHKFFRMTKHAFAIFGAAAIFTLGACGPHRTHTATLTLQNADRTLTVIGRGEATGKPDIASANMGVEASAPTLAEAMNKAKTQMNNLFAALKKLGIAEDDIRTSNFSIHFERPYVPPPMAPMSEPVPAPAPERAPIKGAGKAAAGAPAAAPVAPPPPPPPAEPAGLYHVSNMVEVRIRNLDNVSNILDTIVSAGANNVWGVNFSIDKPENLESKARELAAADAKKRAEVLAKLNGLTLGSIVSVTETPGFGGPPVPMPYAAAEVSGKGTPIAPGEVSVTSQVQIVYSLLPAEDAEDAEEE